MKPDECYTETPDITIFSHLMKSDIEWLWYPYIPRGKITILQGDPGEGKTTLALHLAAALTRGELPDGSGDGKKRFVLYQTAEDGLDDTILPRMIAAGADTSRIFTINEHTEPLDLIDPRLEAALRTFEPALVILDPLQAFLGSHIDMHRANEIRPVMTILAQMAKRYNTAIVLIGHMNKQMGNKSMYRGLGSIDLTASARSVLMMARDPKAQDIRVLMHLKSSLAKEGKPLAFRIGADSALTYEGIYEQDTAPLLTTDTVITRRSRSKQKDAETLLKTALAAGERPCREIQALADQQQISKSTLSHARKALGVIVRKVKDEWIASLPDNEPDSDPDTEPDPTPDTQRVTVQKPPLPETPPQPAPADDYLDPDEWTLILP